jgi:hypothetical protein
VGHFKRETLDDIGQLRREAGWLARLFAEFQAAGCGSTAHIIGVQALAHGKSGPLRATNQYYDL